MDDVFLTARIDNRRSICISPLPAKTYKEAGGKGLGGKLGYFIYETDNACPDAGIEVIGKAASLEAALRLFDLISSAALNLGRPQLRENASADPVQSFPV
jgi:hypothetical protein